MNESLDTKKNVKSQSFNMYRELRLPKLGKVRTIFCKSETFLCVDDLGRKLNMNLQGGCVFLMERDNALDIHMEDGERLSDLCVEDILQCKWTYMKMVAPNLDCTAYMAIMQSRNDYAARLASWDGSVRITIDGAKFALRLYDDFAVSERNCVDYDLIITRRMYLGIHHILTYWGMQTLRDALNLTTEKNADDETDVQEAKNMKAVSFALAGRIKELKLNMRKSLERLGAEEAKIRCDLAEADFRMVKKEDPRIPRSWLTYMHRKTNTPMVTFYPYNTLKDLGLPSIPELEDSFRESRA